MKLAMQYLEQVEHLDITTIISFVFFFSFFLAVLFHVLRTKSSYYESVSNFPLDDGNVESVNNQKE
jgi:cbb3-type cytochrome oxidase subunit 3